MSAWIALGIEFVFITLLVLRFGLAGLHHGLLVSARRTVSVLTHGLPRRAAIAPVVDWWDRAPATCTCPEPGDPVDVEVSDTLDGTTYIIRVVCLDCWNVARPAFVWDDNGPSTGCGEPWGECLCDGTHPGASITADVITAGDIRIDGRSQSISDRSGHWSVSYDARHSEPVKCGVEVYDPDTNEHLGTARTNAADRLAYLLGSPPTPEVCAEVDSLRKSLNR